MAHAIHILNIPATKTKVRNVSIDRYAQQPWHLVLVHVYQTCVQWQIQINWTMTNLQTITIEQKIKQQMV